MMVRAPAVVKLLGEHAVLYGKLSVAAALSMYANVDVKSDGSDTIEISDLGISAEFGRDKLDAMYKDYKQRSSVSSYIAQHSDINSIMLPYATIASRLANELGVGITRTSVSIGSDIPVQSGFASSASCFAAFTTALLKRASKSIVPDMLIDIARDGDRIVHKNENAGGIDVSTSYYGGYVSFSKTRGAKREDISTNLDMLLVDTGPKKSTAETVGHVAELYKSKKSDTEAILEQINECAVKGLAMLKSNDLKGLGSLMFKDHELLKRLGVSSPGLDKAVEIARREGAYGAKLSGGGGGGLAIVIGGDFNRISGALKSAGFGVSRSSVALEGAAAA